MIFDNSRVKTLVEKSGYPAGIVYSIGPACEVELWDDNQYPIVVITYGKDLLNTITVFTGWDLKSESYRAEGKLIPEAVIYYSRRKL